MRIVYIKTLLVFLRVQVTTDGSDPRTSPTAVFKEDWEASRGPRHMLRINSPGLTTVRACSSRGDLADSLETQCTYNVTASALCMSVATSMSAPSWDSWEDIPDLTDVETDDRSREDPQGITDDKDWEGWNSYQGIVCGAWESFAPALQVARHWQSAL